MFASATEVVRSAPAVALAGGEENQRFSRHIADMLHRLEAAVQPQRRVVHAGDRVYQAGEPFSQLMVLNSGCFKLVSLSPDGREQVTGLKFRGDWLGFDGIADNLHTCDAIALDTGEIWLLRYDSLLAACAREPRLMAELHQAMSREIAGDRDSLMSVCTLPADARVAGFLLYWAEALARRGLRTDQITLRLTRAEIGNYLGMSLETVSRALSRLSRLQLIQFAHKGRRDIRIPELSALSAFAQNSLAPAAAMLQ